MSAQILTQSDYESVVRAGLTRIGLTDDQANALLAARWPMDLSGLIAECAARGRLFDVADVSAWLAAEFGRPVDPIPLGFTPREVNELLAWAVEHNRGRVTLAGFISTDHPDVVDTLCSAERSPWN